MVRMDALAPAMAQRMTDLVMPEVGSSAWNEAKPLSEMRVAIVSSAGLHLKTDRPFFRGDADYRVIPSETDGADLFMSHVSSNYDRSGFQEDINVSFPIDRIRELAEEGFIGSIAKNHVSFMGATDPTDMEQNAKEVAAILKEDNVDAVALSGV